MKTTFRLPIAIIVLFVGIMAILLGTFSLGPETQQAVDLGAYYVIVAGGISSVVGVIYLSVL